MARVENDKVTKRIVEITKANIAEGIPNQLSPVVSPVLNVNPIPDLQIVENTTSDNTSGTALTTSTKKKTYLVGVTSSVSKDANNDGTYSSITCTPKGKTTTTILRIRYEPLTASSNLNQVIMFPTPIELAKGSTILVRNHTATASIDHGAVVYYYEVDDIYTK